jgi:uncharacterized protein YoxC
MADIDGGGLHFKSTIDNDELIKYVDETLRRIQGLSDGTVAYGDKADIAFAQAASSVDELKNRIETLKSQQKQLQELINDSSKWGKPPKALTDEYDKISTEIKEAETRIAKYGEKVNTASQAHVSFRTQLRNAREELIAMEQAGLRGTAKYAALQEQVGQLTDAMSDAQAQASVLAHDQRGMQGIISGLTGLSGAFSAATGMVSLFAGENENLQKIMLKVQSLMAITVGLQQLQASLDKDSAFQLVTLNGLKEWWAGILEKSKMSVVEETEAIQENIDAAKENIQAIIENTAVETANTVSEAANTASETANTAAEVANTAATHTNTTATSVNTVATDAQATAATAGTVANLGLAGAFRLVGLAIKSIPVFGWIIAGITALVGLYQLFTSKAREAKKAQEEFNRAVVEMAYKPIASIESLSTKYKRLGDDMQAKKRFIEENKKAFDELGVSVRDVADAQKLLIDNKDDFIKAQIAKASALALTEGDAYKRQLEKSMEARMLLDKEGADYKKLTGKDATYSDPDENGRRRIIHGSLALYNAFEDFQDANEELKKMHTQSLDYWDEYNEILEKASIKTGEIVEDTVEQYEKIHQVTDEIIDGTNETMLDTFKESLAEQLGNAKTVIDRLNLIRQMREDLKKSDDPLKEQKIEILDESEKQSEEDRKQETRQVLEEYADMYDRRLDLAAKYFADLALLEKQKETALTNEEKQRIDRTVAYRKQKYNEDVQNLLEATVHAKIQMIDLARDNTLLEISTKNYLWESDRQKDMLEAQKKAAEETLEQFKKLQDEAPTEELAFEIEQVTLEINEMNAELEKMPNEKFYEMLSGLQKITSTLGELDGELGEIFSGISSNIDNIKVSFDETATTTDKISAGIAGIVDIINMISSASAKRKQVEKEFYRNQIALAHEYALALNEVLQTQSEMSESGFVTDYAGRINDGFNALSDATKNYQEAIGKLSEGKANIDLRNAIDWGNVGKGAASGAAAGAAIGSIVPVIGTAIGAVAGAIIGGLAGLFGGKKKEMVDDSLLGVFPELVDGAGNLNRELAQTLINTNQVNDATKQLIQNAIDWADAMEAAQEQMHEVAVDLAGDLGNGIKNALVEAFRAGEDASKRTFDAASKSLENFIDNLVYGLLFKDYFDKFSSDLEDAMKNDGILDENEIINAYESLMRGVEIGSENYFKALEIIKDRAKGRGFNLWENEAEGKADTSLTGAVKGVTEETASLVAGQMNAIRINQMEATDILRQQLFHLANIDNNTYAVNKNTAYNRYIKDIYDIMSTGDSLRAQGLAL